MINSKNYFTKILLGVLILSLVILIVFTRSSFAIYGASTDLINKWFQIILLMLVGVSMIFKNYTAQLLVFFLFGLCISFTSFYVTKDKTILNILLIMFFFSSYSKKTVVKSFLVVNILSFAIIIISNKLGLLNSVFVQNGSFSSIKNSLGFIHPNTLGITLLIINLLLVYLYREKLKVWHVLGINFINLYFYHFSGARTSMALIILTYIMWALFKYSTVRLLTPGKLVLAYSILILFLFFFSYYSSMSSSLFVTKTFLSHLDELLTGRLTLGNMFIQEYGINLVGHQVSFSSLDNLIYSTGNNYRILDNSYLKLLINYGLIVSISYIFLNIATVYKSIKTENDFWILIPFTIFAFIGFSEQSMLYFWVNFTFFFTNTVFFDDNGGNTEMGDERHYREKIR